MPGTVGSHFVITIPPATKVHCLKWLEKIGTVESESLVDSKQVITILSLKPRRQDGLQRSLRTLFQKRGLPINNVFLISKRFPRSSTHDDETQAGGPEDEEVEEAAEAEIDEEETASEEVFENDVVEGVGSTSMVVAENEVAGVVGRTSVVAESINITNLLDRFMISGKAVRKTQDMPPKVSVYDLIAAVTEQTTKDAWMTFNRMNNVYSSTVQFDMHQFPGRGQRMTPVICSLKIKELVIIIITHAKLPQTTRTELMRQYGIASDTIFCKRSTEAEIIDIICSTFSDCAPLKQHVVHTYRIDLYFPSLKLAIECDENGHSSYNASEEAARHALITATLGCTWVRFDPYRSDFKVGDVLKQIIHARDQSHHNTELALLHAQLLLEREKTKHMEAELVALRSKC